MNSIMVESYARLHADISIAVPAIITIVHASIVVFRRHDRVNLFLTLFALALTAFAVSIFLPVYIPLGAAQITIVSFSQGILIYSCLILGGKTLYESVPAISHKPIHWLALASLVAVIAGVIYQPVSKPACILIFGAGLILLGRIVLVGIRRRVVGIAFVGTGGLGAVLLVILDNIDDMLLIFPPGQTRDLLLVVAPFVLPSISMSLFVGRRFAHHLNQIEQSAAPLSTGTHDQNNHRHQHNSGHLFYRTENEAAQQNSAAMIMTKAASLLSSKQDLQPKNSLQLELKQSEQESGNITQDTSPLRATTQHYEYLWVKSGGKIVNVRAADIIYVEAQQDYVNIATTKGNILALQSMKATEQTLNPHLFRRVHRSYIVALPRIRSIEGHSMIHLVSSAGTFSVPIGKKYREAFFDYIAKSSLHHLPENE